MGARVRPVDGPAHAAPGAHAAPAGPADTPGRPAAGEAEQDLRPGRPPWWRRRRGWLLAALLVLFTAQMAWTAARTQLVDERVALVSLRVGISAEERQEIRRTCGAVEGVGLVEDVGRPELVQRFPARFSLTGATLAEEGALLRCLEQFEDDVVSYQVEGRA